jgi:hypothetical protein
MVLKPQNRMRSWAASRGTWRGLTALRDSAGETRGLGEGVPGWVSDSGQRDFGKSRLAVGVGHVPAGGSTQWGLRQTLAFVHPNPKNAVSLVICSVRVGLKVHESCSERLYLARVKKLFPDLAPLTEPVHHWGEDKSYSSIGDKSRGGSNSESSSLHPIPFCRSRRAPPAGEPRLEDPSGSLSPESIPAWSPRCARAALPSSD